uniref:cerebellin-2 isoform X2 n=1 Tax=Callithrix jacchus TaxID=9483 RepID=UPI0023DD20F5|nr:cerebellin-2 isoform X2 [Callithrix jacchus]
MACLLSWEERGPGKSAGGRVSFQKPAGVAAQPGKREAPGSGSRSWRISGAWDSVVGIRPSPERGIPGLSPRGSLVAAGTLEVHGRLSSENDPGFDRQSRGPRPAEAAPGPARSCAPSRAAPAPAGLRPRAPPPTSPDAGARPGATRTAADHARAPGGAARAGRLRILPGGGAGPAAAAAAARLLPRAGAERHGAHRAGGQVPGGVRLQPVGGRRRHFLPGHLRALRQRQGGLLRHAEHQPRTVRDEQPHHDHLFRPGISKYWQPL